MRKFITLLLVFARANFYFVKFSKYISQWRKYENIMVVWKLWSKILIFINSKNGFIFSGQQNKQRKIKIINLRRASWNPGAKISELSPITRIWLWRVHTRSKIVTHHVWEMLIINLYSCNTNMAFVRLIT